MKQWCTCLLAIAIICTLSGCSQSIKGVGTATGRLSGLQSVDTLPANFLKGYNAFTTNLLKQLYTENGDMFVSPASLTIALGMTANGADTNTLTQLLNTMELDMSTLNTGCRDLQSLLTDNSKNYFQLSNAIWLKDSYKNIIQPDFLNRNEDNYGALIAAVPFDDTLIPTINKWAEQSTDGMIKQLLEPPLDPDVFMYLSNALLFDGKWEIKFKTGDTKEGVFHTAQGDITLPMMHRTDKENATWYEDDDVQATMLDYQDKRTAMLIALPKDNLDDVMAELTNDSLTGWIDGITVCSQLELTLPRFSLTYKQGLIPTLQSMGITDAFDENTADFSRMLEISNIKGRPYISEVIHQTALEVDESGTRAAAVSSFSFGAKSAQPISYTMVVDRPFFCAIVDKPTGAILFAGTVNNPQPIA